MFYYGYMAPSMMPMNQFAQLGPDDRERQQTFSSFAENPRGNYDLYRELDRYGIEGRTTACTCWSGTAHAGPTGKISANRSRRGHQLFRGGRTGPMYSQEGKIKT